MTSIFIMKKITLFLLTLLTSTLINAQDEQKNDTLDRKNNWIIEASVGSIKGVKPYGEGYFSSKTNGYFGQLRPNSFSIGGRYLMGEIFSVKASLGYDLISNFNNESLIDGVPSLPFKMQQINLQVQGYGNGAKLFNIHQRLKRWGFLFHGGIQVVAMTSKTKNIPEGAPGYPNGEVHNYNITEYNGGLMFGVTPQYRIGKRVALQLDVTTVHNYRQHYNWDGTYSDNQENLSGNTVSLNFGVNFSLDKNTIHGDWYVKPKEEDKKIAELEGKIDEMQNLMNDTDKDGVPDYLDQENNSVAGVAVDTRGKMLDINKNGVPDELEKGKDGMNGINSSVISKEDAIKLIIEKGYINVFYDVNKDLPNSGSTNNVYYIIKFLKNYPDAKATLIGFADERGNASDNLDLSDRRANKLLEIIKASGISPSRLSVKASGVDTEFPKSTLGYDLSRRVSIQLE
jgi:OmpA-OmpF porin, OOP family